MNAPFPQRFTTDWKKKLPAADSRTRIRGMLGLAMRAGKVIIGTEQVCLALPRRGRVRLVMVSAGASDATKKKVTVKCAFYGVESIEVEMDTNELGSLLGKTYAPACVAVTDDGFAREILKAHMSDKI